ncbi:MAG: precorrin-4 C(11)-methyltransferase [Candidatus Pelethousia sp.]|nr:precorrin-4 C(11)-methyltransferase [Candidatus Pelethousia sp.]
MIHFVGAGCGAPDLITMRGAALLQAADAIIYAGSLVNPALLDYSKPGCEIFNSAKMTLDEVIAVMTRMEVGGKTTVRLHTGDPSLFGAIREQMDRLESLRIPFDICPGVSSFCGVAATLQAEYTLPAVSQSVIITRMAGKTPVPPGESIRALAAHGATMVIFLSAGMTEQLQAELMAGGYPPDTPAAIVYKASWPDEKVVRCTVSSLHKAAVQNDISNLALITVGGFLGDSYELSKLYDPAFTTAFRQGTNA